MAKRAKAPAVKKATNKKHIVEEALEKRSFDRRHCFLCGARLYAKNNSREHIFPKFVLHRFKLWEQKLTLLNGTEIPYRKVVIPCCKTCNNKYIGRIDRKIAQAVKGGFDEFAKVDEVLVFQWLSRILYSILYLELITSTFNDMEEHGRHCKSLEVHRRQHYCVSRCVSRVNYFFSL